MSIFHLSQKIRILAFASLLMCPTFLLADDTSIPGKAVVPAANHGKAEAPAAVIPAHREEDALSPLSSALAEITRRNRERLEAIETAKKKGDTLLQALLELENETPERPLDPQVPPQQLAQDKSYPQFGKFVIPKGLTVQDRLSMMQTAALLRQEAFMLKTGLENAPAMGTSPALDQLRQRLRQLETDADQLDSLLGVPRTNKKIGPKSPFKP